MTVDEFPEEADLPRLPDAAFDEVVDRVQAFFSTASSAEDWSAATDNFFRSMGLEGQADERANATTRAIVGALQGIGPEEVDTKEAGVGIVGVTIGLLLAQATGWNPPIA